MVDMLIKLALAGIVFFAVLNLAGFHTWVERKQSAVVELGPVHISSIGFICMEPFGGCGAGSIQCAGGREVDTEIVANRDIGSCASNAGCASQCSVFCSANGLPTSRS